MMNRPLAREGRSPPRPPEGKRDSKQPRPGKIRIHAWVSSVYNLTVEVAREEPVYRLYRQIERAFSEGFNLDFKVLALQDPNHNDLPSTCYTKLVIKNNDKVFVVIHPDSLKAQPARKRARTTANGDTSHHSLKKAAHEKKKDIASCFRSYFKLREKLDRPQSVKMLIRSAIQTPTRHDEIENQLILNRIRMISQELENRRPSNNGGRHHYAQRDEVNRIVDRLPIGLQHILCSVGRGIVQEITSPITS